MNFHTVKIPGKNPVFVPNDIEIIIPDASSIPDVEPRYINSLAYIPWDKKYMSYVPEGYRDFYRTILPKLQARTTDVHSALSASFVTELIKLTPDPVDRHVLTTAVLLHDIGWARLSPAQIALSLNYSGLAYTEEALEPKRLHASIGAIVAADVLRENTELDLSLKDKEYIATLVKFHDQINPWPEKPEPTEYLLLGDADRMWSYTHENFWLDTIRKNTEPRAYLQNITEVIDTFFLTKAGATIAHRCAATLADEVMELERYLEK